MNISKLIPAMCAFMLLPVMLLVFVAYDISWRIKREKERIVHDEIIVEAVYFARKEQARIVINLTKEIPRGQTNMGEQGGRKPERHSQRLVKYSRGEGGERP